MRILKKDAFYLHIKLRKGIYFKHKSYTGCCKMSVNMLESDLAAVNWP